MMKKISKRIFNFWLFIVFFAGLFILSFTFLNHGIKIQNFNIAGIKIEEFYLRLDKKFILEIDSINLENLKQDKGDKMFNAQNQLQYIKNIHSILQFFQSIKIHSIKYEDYMANLFYDGNHFIINLPDLYAKLSTKDERSLVLVNIEQLYLKKYGILYIGKGSYDTKKRFVDLSGKVSLLDKKSYENYISLNMHLTSDFKSLNLQGDSAPFKSIKYLREILPKIHNPHIDAWIFDNYTFENAKISDFSIKIPLQSKEILKESLKSLLVNLEAQNAKVFFHKNLSPINSKDLKLIFKNNSLEFYPKNISYKKHNLNGSFISIQDITDKKTSKLNISIKTNTKLDDDILELLKNYNITLPISIPNTKIDSTLFLGIHLSDLAMDYHGIFYGKKAEVFLNKTPLNSDEIEVKLDNNIIDISTKNTTYKDMLLADSNFIIDTNIKQIAGDLNIHSLMLSQDSKELFFMENHTLPFSVDFSDSKNIKFDLPTLNITSNFQENNYNFKLTNLAKFRPFSKTLSDYSIHQGNITITSKDFANFYADIYLNSSQKILLEKDNTPIKDIALKLESSPNMLKLFTKDKRISYLQEKEKSELELQNINIAINPNENQNSSKKALFIKGKNSNFLFKDKVILADSYKISLNNDEISLQLRHKNGLGNIYKKGKFINIDAKEFGDEFLNTIFKKEVLKAGRFFINASTDKNGVLLGQIRLQNTSLNQIHLLQNMMAFIDTIPSLLSFKVPGFNNQGYYVQNGIIDFGFDEKIFAIQKLDFQGSSIDIKGDGIFLLNDNKIDFRAQLITAKALSGIINKIPVVNFILLGRDGTISTGFKIEGSLENPKITTQTTQDFLLAPFNILKRTITSPLEIFK